MATRKQIKQHNLEVFRKAWEASSEPKTAIKLAGVLDVTRMTVERWAEWCDLPIASHRDHERERKRTEFIAAFDAMEAPRTAPKLAAILEVDIQTIYARAKDTGRALEGKQEPVAKPVAWEAYEASPTLGKMGDLLGMSVEGARKACKRFGWTKYQKVKA